MTTGGFKRKLTTVFSADVAGYSRLMGEDEAATVKTLTAYRGVMAELVKQHGGGVIDSPGDNLLAEFTSVVDAVQCGVAVQKELQARNAELPENRRMEFRIGINLGDVIEEEDRIYGDGVNIAARLEALADPGGICISKTAFDQIETKLPLGYQFLGEQTVKNITKPVGAYKVLMEPRVIVEEKKEEAKGISFLLRKRFLVSAVAVLVVLIGVAIWNFYFRPPYIPPADPDKMAYPMPEKPSIAVLPFVNMSEDPKQEFFSDGLTEQIITGLSKVPYLFVIARNSVFTYKDKPVKVQQVSEELGVRYVLEGSVQKTADRVRITVQLIDATKGHHLWAERYDRDLKDLFALQDEITMKVITELQVKLADDEYARVVAKGTKNLDAYLKLLQGLEIYNRANAEDNALARQWFEEAIALDPEYANAYAFLSLTRFMDVWYGSSKSFAEAMKLAQKAIDIDDSLALPHSVQGNINTHTRQYDKGIAECERAVAINPNDAVAHMWLGMSLYWADRADEAIPVLKKAMRLDPISPSWSLLAFLAMAYRDMGRYEEAISACKTVLNRWPDNILVHLILAAAYSMSGRDEEARAEAAEVLRINPDYSLERFAQVRPHKSQENTARFVDALRKAGLK